MTTTSASQASSDGRRSTAPSVRLPIRFSSETPEYHGFLTYSAHRVMYNDVIYPTAMHLHEALKYLPVDPAFAERIRACPDPGEVHTLSAELQRQSPNSVRPDWPTVFLQSMEDVILLKFQQHSNLRGLLLNTLDAPLVYAEPEAYWGETGSNHLGHMLERVRTSLQRELEGRLFLPFLSLKMVYSSLLRKKDQENLRSVWRYSF
ncbi:S5A-REDUCTASE domain-containing protein [Mycena sanguinolenta]|uniref:S5A-REDUCTASE domain-containing protein n=1 Tax=Mycena sanguinolenta TaxID=230812 RepID=A0A8H6Z5P0_9AGAR|nr:S5A-REDUCTASE domain-containing protein [Mycena sanguinolenta]